MDKTEEFDALKKLAARFQENPIEFKSQFTPRPEPSLTRSEKWDRIEKLWDEYTELVKQEGNFAKIIGCMDSIIQLDPKNAYAWGNKGIALANSGKSEEAIECYDNALEVDPKDARTWYNKGNAIAN